ncbi:MAG TPA: FecR domain-containing protein, partial [Phenylobacterium sp.]|nr:FecR domain-containing protein [Phenylobacterium sp.]
MTVAAGEAEGMTRIVQDLGSILFQVDKQARPHFRVETSLLAAVVKGTTFTVSISAVSDTVHVAEGLVAVQAMNGGLPSDISAGVTGQVLRDAPDQVGVITPSPVAAAPDPGVNLPSLDYSQASDGLVSGPGPSPMTALAGGAAAPEVDRGSQVAETSSVASAVILARTTNAAPAAVLEAAGPSAPAATPSADSSPAAGGSPNAGPGDSNAGGNGGAASGNPNAGAGNSNAGGNGGAAGVGVAIGGANLDVGLGSAETAGGNPNAGPGNNNAGGNSGGGGASVGVGVGGANLEIGLGLGGATGGNPN